MTHTLSCPFRSPFRSGNFALKLRSDSLRSDLIYRKPDSVNSHLSQLHFHRFCLVILLKCIFCLICLKTLLRWDHLSTSNNTRFKRLSQLLGLDLITTHPQTNSVLPHRSVRNEPFLKQTLTLLLCGLVRATGWRQKWNMKSVKPPSYFCFRRTGLGGCGGILCFVLLF